MNDNRDLDQQHRHLFELSFGKRPAEELYDLKSDPKQMTNVASDPSYSEPVQHLREKLFTRLKETNDPRVTKEGPDFDAFSYDGWKPKSPQLKNDKAE